MDLFWIMKQKLFAKTGEPSGLVFSATIYPENGYIEGSIVDITERKKAEKERDRLQKQLLQSQKMETIGTLAGGIAHDFNNILYPIIGFAEMSILDLPGDHPVRENLEDILQGAKRARDLVRQILLFSSQKGTDVYPRTDTV